MHYPHLVSEFCFISYQEKVIKQYLYRIFPEADSRRCACLRDCAKQSRLTEFHVFY